MYTLIKADGMLGERRVERHDTVAASSEVAGRIKLERVNLKLAPRRSAPSGLGSASCKDTDQQDKNIVSNTGPHTRS